MGLVQHDDHVEVELSDGDSLRATYVVGCDGGRSVVRKAAGIDFVGWDPTTSWLIAEVDFADEPEIGVRPEGGGIGPVDPKRGGNPYRVVLTEAEIEHEREPTLEDVRDTLTAKFGRDFGLLTPRGSRASPTRLAKPRLSARSRVGRRRRRARPSAAGRPGPQHRRARCGEPGVEAGAGRARRLTRRPPRHLPRRTASGGERVLQSTMAMVALQGADERHQALRDTMTELLRMDEPRTASLRS